MQRVFVVVAALILMIWGGSNLWLSGFEAGYEAGEATAWDRANALHRIDPRKKSPVVRVSHAQSHDDGEQTRRNPSDEEQRL